MVRAQNTYIPHRICGGDKNVVTTLNAVNKDLISNAKFIMQR